MRNQYKTQQKKILLKFLEENCNKQLSIEEMLSLLPLGSMGKSTVYRLVHNLTEEGILKRYMRENTKTFVYQLFDKNHRAFYQFFHSRSSFTRILIHTNRSRGNASDISRPRFLFGAKKPFRGAAFRRRQEVCSFLPS